MLTITQLIYSRRLHRSILGGRRGNWHKWAITDGEGTAQMNLQSVPEYVGHVERDPSGALWAVLYAEGQVLRREQVRSLRQGRRRATDLVLAAADSAARADSFARMRGNGLPEQAQSPDIETVDHPPQPAGRHARRSRPPLFHDP